MSLLEGALVKTTRFRHPSYVGDPINAVRIFNDKEVDELMILDIAASGNNASPDFALARQLAREAFMPVAYGGGIRTLSDASRLFESGVEKLVLNTAAVTNPEIISGIAERFGSQAVVAALDVTRRFTGRYECRIRSGRESTGRGPAELARIMIDRGAGEILLTSIDRDGSRSGYDLRLIEEVSGVSEVPLIACGGAGTLIDLKKATAAGASAVAAGSIFIYHGPHKAVLLSYPARADLEAMLP